MACREIIPVENRILSFDNCGRNSETNDGGSGKKLMGQMKDTIINGFWGFLRKYMKKSIFCIE